MPRQTASFHPPSLLLDIIHITTSSPSCSSSHRKAGPGDKLLKDDRVGLVLTARADKLNLV
eukprot:1020502-Rhodomonas_salina.1